MIAAFRRWAWRRIDERGVIPRWAFWIWPKAHWCPELDGLLVLRDEDGCFCDGGCTR